MLIVISPAKRLNWDEREMPMTVPEFGAEALRLARTMRNLTLQDLRGLMGLSDDLARLNRDRFRAYAEAPEPGALRPALFAFAGDTYQGFDAATLPPRDLARAQEQLRILSGLYGVLRPSDGIQPYRLEMGSRLTTRRGRNLYDFWRDLPARSLRAQAQAIGTGMLLNCASKEYFGAVDPARLQLEVITPMFLEATPGAAPRMVSFHAKRARGAMARFAIETGAATVADLHGFDRDGYRYDAERSSDAQPVFVRAAPRG